MNYADIPLVSLSHFYGQDQKKAIGSRFYYITLLTVVMLAAAIPGWILVPYSINPFDEPYQILNALDWQNAVYSPLSSRLANWFGEAFDWKYLAFRRLSFFFCFVSMYCCAVYALAHSGHKLLVLLISAFATFAILGKNTFYSFYGWDSWTLISITFTLLSALSLFDGYSFRKVIIFAILAGITSLMRISNLTLICFAPAIVFLATRRSGLPLRRSFTATAACLVISGGMAVAILSLLYGSVGTFIERFRDATIGDHSYLEILKPLVSKFIIAVIYSAVYYCGYRLLVFARTGGKVINWSVMIALTLIFAMVLCISNTFMFGKAQTGALGLILLGYFYLLRNRDSRKKWGVILISIFLLSLVSAIGSNNGFNKALSWPLLPLFAAFIGNGFTPLIKRFCGVWCAGYILFFGFSLTQRSFLDSSLKELDYEFKSDEGPLAGMRTNAERGEFISAVYRDMKPYLQAGTGCFHLRLKIPISGNTWLCRPIHTSGIISATGMHSGTRNM